MTTATAAPVTTPVATPAAPVVPAVETPAEDDFDAVFAEITKDTAPAPVAKTPEELEAEAAAAAAAAAALAAGDGTAVKTPEEVAAEEAAAAAAAAVAAPDPAKQLEDALAKIAEMETAAAAVKAAPAAPAATETPTAPVTPEAPAWYQPTDEEKAILAAHVEQWPDIDKAEAIRTKAAVFNAVQYVFSQIKKQYDPVLDRFGAMSDAIEQQITLTMLEKDHSDYSTIRDKVEEWVATLPTYQKLGAQQVMKEGTPEEVSQLVSDYKKAHPVAAASTPPAAPAAVKTELSAAAKKAAGKLTVVDSKRTTATAAADPNDFDAAWAEASAAGK